MNHDHFHMHHEVYIEPKPARKSGYVALGLACVFLLICAV